MSEKETYNDFFANTKPVRLFFKASIPGAIGMLASNIYYLCESLIVGRVLGDDAFAAMNLGLPFILITFALADLVGVGSSVHIAIKMGEGKRDEADRIFSLAVVLIFVFTFVMSTILLIFAPSFFRIMGADAKVSDLAVEYVRVYCLFAPITGFAFAFDNYLRICGKVRLSMLINIFMALVCAMFEFIFMLGFHLPLGYAAFGTSLGMSITALVLIILFSTGKMALHFRVPRFRWNYIKDIIGAGLPAFLGNMAGRVISILMNFLLLSIGGTASVSIYGIVMNIDAFVICIQYGICDSLQPAVGYNFGSQNMHRVKALERCCYGASAIISAVFGVLMLCFSKSFVVLFLGNGMDANFMKEASFAVVLYALACFVRWFSYASQSFFSAIGYSRLAVFLSGFGAFVFPLISILLLWPLSVNGLYLNTALTSLLSAMLAIVLLGKTIRSLKQAK